MTKDPARYFVDEAGDSVLWARRGQPLVGTPGCSSFFLLGMAAFGDRNALAVAMADLRAELLADPYFLDVPSLQPTARKTAVCFHAKDDLPEVRREVFSLLLRHEVEFHAVVRNKAQIMRIVTEFRKVHPDYVYDQNQLYDDLVRRLMSDKLHQRNAYSVTFARRGKATRTRALMEALENARQKHCARMGIKPAAKLNVTAEDPASMAELQAVDYLLWAIQRLYEKGEDRFAALIWPKVHCVWDCDDTLECVEGIRYTKEKPLSAACLLPVDIGSPD